MAVSTQLGMGAMPFGGGTGFRVWTPFAMSVAVAGTFNGWNPANGPLTSEGNGYWSTDIPNAKIDAQHKFVLTSPYRAGLFWKNDPYVRSMTNSVGNGIIADPSYVFQSVGYSTPAWNEMVIYERFCVIPAFHPILNFRPMSAVLRGLTCRS